MAIRLMPTYTTRLTVFFAFIYIFFKLIGQRGLPVKNRGRDSLLPFKSFNQSFVFLVNHFPIKLPKLCQHGLILFIIKINS